MLYSGKDLASIVILCICTLSIGGCISGDDLQASVVGYTSENPDHVDIRGSNLALRSAANALEEGNRTAFMKMLYPYHGTVGGEVLDFDFSSPRAAALARGMRDAKVTGSEGGIWRSIEEIRNGSPVLSGDSAYDRVDYETAVNGETYTIVMVRELDFDWTLARLYSANSTFVQTDGASSSLVYYH